MQCSLLLSRAWPRRNSASDVWLQGLGAWGKQAEHGSTGPQEGSLWDAEGLALCVDRREHPWAYHWQTRVLVTLVLLLSLTQRKVYQRLIKLE